jgi:acyl-CoA synthetase (NDP forming)
MPVLACFRAAGGPPGALRAPEDRESAVGTIPSYRFPESAARSLAHAARYRAWLDRPAGRHPQLTGVDADAARAVVAEAQARQAEWLSAAEIARLMEAAGIPLARQQIAADPAAAAAAAESMGFPVVVKVISPDILHKSDVGGVVLGLASADAVRAACEQIRERVTARGARLDGYLVQEQARSAHEVLVGVTADPVFGPLVGFGLGGTTAEALRDTAFRITPLTDVDAAEMVRAIRGHVLLEGFRGQPAADITALEDLLLRVSWLADTVAIDEMDLNPVVAYEPGAGLLVLDARVAIRPA